MSKEVVGEVTAVPERSCGGAGWSVQRAIGEGAPIDFLDPILLLEEVCSDVSSRSPALPWAPYAGLVRAVYVLDGGIEWTARHPTKGDKTGSALKGDAFILHSHQGALVQATPIEDYDASSQRLRLLEVWVRDAVQNGGKDPLVDTYRADELPTSRGPGWAATVIMGRFNINDPLSSTLVGSATPCCIVDFRLEGGKSLEYAIPEGWHAAVYVYEGEVEMQSNMKIVPAGTLTVLGPEGCQLEVWAQGGPSRFVVVAGRAVGSDVEREGTLVAASRHDLRELMSNEAFAAALRATEDVRRSHSQARASRPPAFAQQGDGGGGGAEGTGSGPSSSPSSGSPSSFSRDILLLHDNMERYEREFKAYSEKWVGYLQKLHQKIKDDPSNTTLREEYKARHRQYNTYLAQYNDKVREYNEKKAAAAGAPPPLD